MYEWNMKAQNFPTRLFGKSWPNYERLQEDHNMFAEPPLHWLVLLFDYHKNSTALIGNVADG